jgi:hypothetical protein
LAIIRKGLGSNTGGRDSCAGSGDKSHPDRGERADSETVPGPGPAQGWHAAALSRRSREMAACRSTTERG